MKDSSNGRSDRLTVNDARRPKVSQLGSPADIAARERTALLAANAPMYFRGRRIERRNGRPLRAR